MLNKLSLNSILVKSSSKYIKIYNHHRNLSIYGLRRINSKFGHRKELLELNNEITLVNYNKNQHIQNISYMQQHTDGGGSIINNSTSGSNNKITRKNLNKLNKFGCNNEIITRKLHDSTVQAQSLLPLFLYKNNNIRTAFYDIDGAVPYYGQRDSEQKNAEDVLFDMFRNDDGEHLPVGKFLAALRTCGIRMNDPRIREMMDNLRKVHRLQNLDSGTPETQILNRETFKSVVAPNIVLIAKAFRHQFVIPDFLGFTKDIEDVYWKCKSNTDGKVAAYIPQLSRMNPDYWGISVCTIDGQRFSIGDVNVPFTLQSCSKPLTYAIALEKLGQELVHQYVGQEPSGRNFNELVLDYNKKPHNPMINAGAILVCSLLKTLVKPEMTLAEKFDYTQQWLTRLSGGENFGFNNAVFLSEREAADRNYALGFYMREHKCYPDKANLRECMDFYFQCCSMEATCDTMSVIAATLANGGICPLTEEKVLRSEVVRDVLSLMHSCGMYDYSGQFAFKVGLPAKSGVCGGMLVVIPNVMGIFTFSPPLDPLGNSCRGVQFCEELVQIFNFHRYDNLKHASNKKDPRRHRYETKGLSIVNLLFSAASGDVTALRRHKLSGMDITLSDYDGRTALHLAASEGHLDCVEFLLEQCHVPYDPRDRWGNLPIDEAETFGHQAVVDFLHTWALKHEHQQQNGGGGDASGDNDSLNQSISTDDTNSTRSMSPQSVGSLSPPIITKIDRNGYYDKSVSASPFPGDKEGDK